MIFPKGPSANVVRTLGVYIGKQYHGLGQVLLTCGLVTRSILGICEQNIQDFKRPHKHKNPANHGSLNPHYLEPETEPECKILLLTQKLQCSTFWLRPMFFLGIIIHCPKKELPLSPWVCAFWGPCVRPKSSWTLAAASAPPALQTTSRLLGPASA